jgi:glutathione peroxidase
MAMAGILLTMLCGGMILAQSPLDYTVKDIAGQDVELKRYMGQVVMIVNTASRCGFTPQYEGLQKLYETYKDQGFVILAFPSNDFMGQEPGTNAEIREFCTANYGVTFPLFAKVSVKGEDACPVYVFLTGEDTNPGFAGKITWNFNKFLVGRDGKVIARFDTRTAPLDREVTAAVEAALVRKSATN